MGPEDELVSVGIGKILAHEVHSRLPTKLKAINNTSQIPCPCHQLSSQGHKTCILLTIERHMSAVFPAAHID